MSRPLGVRSGLLTGVFSAFALMSPALAQEAPPPPAQTDDAVEEVADSDEIVVTATGRSAALQDVPVAITAITADTIANANFKDLRAVEQIAPSFKVFTGQSNAASTILFIRGIGTGGDNAGFEPAVGVFIDGVFRNRSSTAISELPQVERIEVLRGPQGTLFGRNTSAGALSVTTAGPEFDTRVFGKVEIGNFDAINTSLGLTGAIIKDVLAARIETNWQNRDGYINEVNSGRTINNRNRYFVRGQLLWNISESASFRFIADVNETNEECCAAIVLNPGATAPAVNAVAGLRGLPGILPPDLNARNVSITPGRNYNEAIDEWGLSGQLDWDIGGVNLKSITAYRQWVALRGQDVDFGAHDRAYRDGYRIGYNTFSQELTLQGVAGPLDWLVGGFFYQETINTSDNIQFGIDASRYVDAVASGVDINGPAPGGAGFNIFGSLGTTGCGPAAAIAPNCRLFTAALTPAITQQLVAAGVPLATAQAQAFAQASGFSALIAANPQLNGQGQNRDNFGQNTTAFAFFTHNEIDILENVKLTLGVRYNHENKQLVANLNSVSPTCDAFRAAAPLTQAVLSSSLATFALFGCNPVVNTAANGNFNDERTESEVTGTGNLSWKVTENLLLYGGYSRGYKSGGFNLDRSGFNVTPASNIRPSTDDLEFGAEFTNAYEVGWKLSVPAIGTTFNGDFFIERVNQFQLNAFNGFNFQTFNVPLVDSRGFELDSFTRFGQHLTFQGGVAYTDSTLAEPGPVAGGTLPAGTRSSFIPRWTVTGATTYKHPIGFGLYGLVYADARFQSSYPVRTNGRIQSSPGVFVPIGQDPTDNDAFVTANARVSIGDEDGHWDVSFFVSNITDKFFIGGAFEAPEQATTVVYPSQPRTFSAQLKFNF